MKGKKNRFFFDGKCHSLGLLVVTGVFGFSIALLLFLLSPYLRGILHTENVAWLYPIPELFVLGFFSFFLRRAKQCGKTRVFLAAVVVQIFFLFFLTLGQGSLMSIVGVAAYLFLIPFFMMLLDAFLEEESEDEEAGRARGLHILFFNGGMLPAPFFAGMLMERFGYSGVFLAVIGCYVCMGWGIFVLRRKKREACAPETALSFREAWKKLARNGDLLLMYGISVLLEGFYGITAFAFPLFLADAGLDFSQSGFIFTCMLLPFLLFSYPAGRLADTRWGEKEMLVGALLFLSVVFGIVAVTVSSSVWVWAILLPLTRVGAALIETMRDAYFYKQVDGNDFDVIAFFRTARSVGIILATSGAFLFFSWTHSFRELFFLSAGILLVGSFFALRLRDTEPKRV